MTPLRIEVSGQSTIYRPAERAVISITIHSEGTSQDDVSTDVGSTATQVRDLLKSLATKDTIGEARPDAPITHWSNSTLSTGSFFKYSDDGEKKTRLHEASMSFEAKFQDFAKLGSVATALSTMKFVSINNVAWQLTEKTRVEYNAQCRLQAVQDAITKAKDFAAALDIPAPPVVEIKDQDSGYGGPTIMRQVAMERGPGMDRDDLSFSPEDVSMNCSVLVVCEQK